jgi:hypothetical protein
MTREEAAARCTELNRERKDGQRWFVSQAGTDEWHVVAVALPAAAGAGPLNASVVFRVTAPRGVRSLCGEPSSIAALLCGRGAARRPQSHHAPRKGRPCCLFLAFQGLRNTPPGRATPAGPNRGAGPLRHTRNSASCPSSAPGCRELSGHKLRASAYDANPRSLNAWITRRPCDRSERTARAGMARARRTPRGHPSAPAPLQRECQLTHTLANGRRMSYPPTRP